MGRPTNEERERRVREATAKDTPLNEMGPGTNPLERLNTNAQEYWDRMNQIDERAPDRRPAQPVNVMVDPVETAPDERKPADDVGRALNQMVGRAAITENDNPLPGTRPIPPTVDPYGREQGKGTEIRLTRGYQQEEGQPKRQAGEVISLQDKEARRLVNLGAARFTDV